jgi:hypothetical protein
MADVNADRGVTTTGVVRTFDHQVVAVPDLAAGVREFEELTGVRTTPGGSHPGRGTANHIVPLVPHGWAGEPLTYLEILGPDPQQAPDLAALSLPGVTRMLLQRGAAHPDDLDATVAAAEQAGVDFGQVFDMSRHTPDGGLLKWRLTRRTPLAHGGAQPFLIDWGTSQHPADTLREVTVTSREAAGDAAREPGAASADATGDSSPEPDPVLVLERLEFYGPEPDVLREAIRVLTGETVEVTQAPEPGVRAVMSGPAGECVID